MVDEIDLRRPRGDTYADVFDLKTADDPNVALDITGYSFRMSVDPAKKPADDTANLFTLTGTILNAANGQVEFAPTALQADQTPGVYFYDIEMTDTQGRIKTIIRGKYIFDQDITK